MQAKHACGNGYMQYKDRDTPSRQKLDWVSLKKIPHWGTNKKGS